MGRAPGTDALTAQAIRKDFYEQSQQFPQNVTALETYFSEENVSAKVRAFPAEGTKVPIWILGSSRESAVLAAAKGLPYAFAGHFAPREMLAAFQLYRENFQTSRFLEHPKIMACINAIAADTDKEAEILSTSLYQMFQSLVQNTRKPHQPPVESLTQLMNEMSEEAHFQVNQLTACSFVGSTQTVTTELKEFIRFSKVDELMICTPIYDYQAKLKSVRLLKQLMDNINNF